MDDQAKRLAAQDAHLRTLASGHQRRRLQSCRRRFATSTAGALRPSAPSTVLEKIEEDVRPVFSRHANLNMDDESLAQRF